MLTYFTDLIHSTINSVHAWVATATGGDPVAASIIISAVIGTIFYITRGGFGVLKELAIRHMTVVMTTNNVNWDDRLLFKVLNSHLFNILGTNKSKALYLTCDYMGSGSMRTVFLLGDGFHLIFFKRRPLFIRRWSVSENTNIVKEFISIRTVGRRGDLLKDFINSIIPVPEEANTHLSTYDGVDQDWQFMGRFIKRPITNISLDPAVREGVLKQLEVFKNGKEWSRRHLLRHKRTFMFYGPPGTGKTSLAQAIATELDTPVYNVNFSNMSMDKLKRAVAGLDNGVVILIEDIHSEKSLLLGSNEDFSKDDRTRGSDLSKFLNFLDGISGVEDMIIIMTTNYLERIEPAIYREGRVDYLALIDFLDKERIIELIKLYYPTIEVNRLELTDSIRMSGGQIQNLVSSAMEDEELFIKMLNIMVAEMVEPCSL